MVSNKCLIIGEQVIVVFLDLISGLPSRQYNLLEIALNLAFCAYN